MASRSRSALRSDSGNDRQISNFSGSTVCGLDTVGCFSGCCADAALARGFKTALARRFGFAAGLAAIFRAGFAAYFVGAFTVGLAGAFLSSPLLPVLIPVAFSAMLVFPVAQSHP